MNTKFKFMAASLVMAASASIAHGADFTLNLHTSQVADDPIYKGLVEFKKNVEARSQGRIAVKAFPASQLGSDEDVIEQMRAGSGVALITDGGRMELYHKDFGILIAPYITNNYNEMRKLVLSPLVKQWSEKLREKAGFQVFSFNWYQGERNVVTNKLVTKPSDLAGIRMRTVGAPVWIETTRGLGASPTPMPWSEAYSALAMKAIDAVEVQYPSLWGSRIYEVTKYVAKTHHIQLMTGLVGSAAWFNKLPKDLQQIIQEESLKAGDYASKLTLEAMVQVEKDIKSKGMTVTEVDVKPFMQSTQVVYDKFGYNELRKQVNEVVQAK